MDPLEDTLNIGATLPRQGTPSSGATPSAELELQATIRMPGSGSMVFNRYQLQRVLGRGGMGVVWLAKDTKLDREVALKFLPDVIGADPVALQELKEETRRGLDLAHPNIVRIYDFVDDEEAAAISMEFVDGKSLSERRLTMPNNIFTVAHLAPWVSQMCEALDYAHLQRRIVHRDLKPANLMVNSESQLKITDFGIARSVSDTMSRLSMARANTSGTLLYMSPQQAMGDRPKATDDIYSLGATVYELLSGKPPFYSGDISMQITAKNPPSVRQRREELEIPAKDDIPKDWEDALAACLSKDPAQRPQTAGELARRLGLSVRIDTASLGVRVRADGPRPLEVKTDRSVDRRPVEASPAKKWLPLAALLFLFLLVSAGGVYWWLHRPAQWSVQTDPPGALITFEGRTQVSPASFGELPPGSHSATVTMPGFEPQVVKFELKPGQKGDPFLVSMERSRASVLLLSEPNGADFEIKSLDDPRTPKIVGKTPKTLILPIGQYDLLMRRAGEIRTSEIEVRLDHENTQTTSFTPVPVPAPMVAAAAPAPAAMPSSSVEEPPAAAPAPAPGPTPTPAPSPPAGPQAGPAPAPAPTMAANGDAPPAPAPSPGPAASTPAPGAEGVPPAASTPGADPTVAAAGPAPVPVPMVPQPPVTTPPNGYWNIDEIFSNSGFNAYSKNGRAYLLYEAQDALKEKKHYSPRVDGQVGPGTHKAIISFQEASGLLPTGQLDGPTIAALGLSSAEDNKSWSPPQRRRSSSSGGGDDDDAPGWWRTNVANPFLKKWRR